MKGQDIRSSAAVTVNASSQAGNNLGRQVSGSRSSSIIFFPEKGKKKKKKPRGGN